MKEINRTAAIQALPVVCNDSRNISCVHHSRRFQEFPRALCKPYSREVTAATTAELPHRLLPADGCSTGNSYMAQAARRAIWMGAFWKKGGGKVRKQERKEQN